MSELYTVRNAQGATLSKGQAVYVSGSSSGTLLVRLAKADSTTTLPVLGLVESDILDNTLGNIVTHGQLTPLDTSSFNEGDRLYASGSIAGALTNTKPNYPFAAQLVAYVATKSVSAGVLEVVAEGSQPVYGTMLELHAPTHYVGGIDPLTGSLDANARVEVLTSGVGVGTRRKINFHPVSGIGLTASDDPSNERVNISLSAATGGGGGGGVMIQASNTTFTSGTVEIVGSNIVTVKSGAQQVIIDASTSQSVQTQERFDLTLAGNTAGALALVSSGTATLAGGNNITLSQAGNAITVSGPNTVAQSVQTQGFLNSISVLGNTAGNTSAGTGSVILAGGNNLTLSGSTAAGGMTLTISAFNQSVQTQQNIQSIAASNTTYHTGQVEFTGSNMVTVKSSAGQRVVIDATQTVQTQGFLDSISVLGNTVGNTSAGTGSLILAGGNNITLSGATAAGGMTLTISGPNTSAHSVFSGGISGGNTAGDTGTVTGRMVLAGGNNITLSGSTNAGSMTITVSAFNQSVQTQGIISAGMSDLGNTSGSSGLADHRLVLVGSDGIIFSQSTAAGGSNTLSIINSWSTATTVSSVASANAIGANAGRFALEGHQHAGVPAIAAGSNTGTTLGNTASQHGTWVIAGSGNVTVSGSTGGAGVHTAWVSVPAGGGAAPTLSHFNNLMPGISGTAHMSSFSSSNAILFLSPMVYGGLFPGNMTVSTLLLDMSGSGSSNTSGAHTYTISVGIYTQANASQLSLLESGSRSWALGATSNNSASYHGMRWFSMESSHFDNFTLSNGSYWMGFWMRSSSVAYSLWIMGVRVGHSGTRSGYMVSASTSANSVAEEAWHGNYTVSFTTGMPAALNRTDMQLAGSDAGMFIPHYVLNNWAGLYG